MTGRDWRKNKDDMNINMHIGKRSCVEIGKTNFTITNLEHKNDLIRYNVLNPSLKVVKDEYGQEFTAWEMLDEINECSIIKESRYKFC